MKNITCRKLKVSFNIILIAFIMMMHVGCTGTIVFASKPENGGWKASVYRVSILQKVSAPSIDVPNLFKMDGYTSDGGNDLVGQLIRLGLETAAKRSIAPVVTPIVNNSTADPVTQ